MDWKGCELVEFDPCRSMGRAVVKNSSIRADTVVESWELGETLESISHAYHLDYYDVRNLLIFADKDSALERAAPVDWTACNLVEIIPGKVSGKPIVSDSRVMADQLVDSFELGESIDDIAYNFSLEPELIRGVLQFAGLKEELPLSA